MNVMLLNFPKMIIYCKCHLFNGVHAYTMIRTVTMRQHVITSLLFHSDQIIMFDLNKVKQMYYKGH